MYNIYLFYFEFFNYTIKYKNIIIFKIIYIMFIVLLNFKFYIVESKYF